MKSLQQKRRLVRICSYITALVVVLLSWGITQTVRRRQYETEMNITRSRAIAQLCEYFDSIETGLTKGAYANTPPMLAQISSDLRRQASGAKTALSTLDTGDTQLFNIYKYLSQAGEYTSSLGRKAAAGETITDEERGQLLQLTAYARKLKEQFSYMNELLEAGAFSFTAVNAALNAAGDAAGDSVSFLSSAAGAEESFSDFPTLLYDGPFSDGILNKKSKLLAEAPEVSANKAQQIAANMLGAPEAAYAVDDGESDGRLPVRTFTYNGKVAAVTKNGGYLCYLLSDAFAGESIFTGEEAVAIAAAFLQKAGYMDMVSSYYATNDGICTVNFAYQQGNYICYPDLIKVGVSLSDGTIVALDASAYLMNHSARSIPAEELAPKAAMGALREDLRIGRIRCAVIPTPSAGEKYTYEFLCTDPDGQDALVYIDTTTGEEDEILLLLYSDGGTLTK